MVPKKPRKDVDGDLDHLIRDVHRLQLELMLVAQAILKKIDGLNANNAAIQTQTDKLTTTSAALSAAIEGDSTHGKSHT